MWEAKNSDGSGSGKYDSSTDGTDVKKMLEQLPISFIEKVSSYFIFFLLLRDKIVVQISQIRKTHVIELYTIHIIQ